MTTPTAITDAIRNLEILLEQSYAAIAADHAQVDADYNAAVLQLQATIADLEERLEAYEGIPTLTVFGASQPNMIGPNGTRVPLARAYVPAGKRPARFLDLPVAQRNAIQLADKAVILSWKEPPGTWLEQLLDDIGRTFPSLQLIGCQNHEPFDNFTTPAQIANYHARWDIASVIMAQYKTVGAVILDGSHPESWDTFARDDVTYLGVDRYNPGIQDAKAYVDPATVFGPYVTWLYSADHPGQLGLIGETGTPRIPSDATGAGQRKWIVDAHDYLAQHVEWASWWSVDNLTLTPELLDLWLDGGLA